MTAPSTVRCFDRGAMTEPAENLAEVEATRALHQVGVTATIPSPAFAGCAVLRPSLNSCRKTLARSKSKVFRLASVRPPCPTPGRLCFTGSIEAKP